MATTPNFISVPRIGTCTVSTANTNTDGTGSITELQSGSGVGTRVLEIVAQGSGATVSGLVNVFYSDDAGVTWKYFDSIYIEAATPSATAPGYRNWQTYQNLMLTNENFKLGVSTTVAQTINVFALSGDL